MVQRIVDTIINKQIEGKAIREEDVGIYRYGYTVLCEVLLNVFFSMVIGIISGDMLLVLLFLFIYIPLRSFCGGWHADKIWKCTILSNLIILAMVVMDEYCVNEFTIDVYVWSFAVCVILVFFMAPIDTKTKILSVEEKEIYKVKINIILLSSIALMVVVMILGVDKIAFVLTFSYVIQVIVLIIEIINKEKLK